MTNQEYMLAKLSEECAEAIERIQKCLIFGVNEVQDGHTQDNATRAAAELKDVMAVAVLLHRDGMLPDFFPTPVEIDRKRAKIEMWKQRSIETGALK